MLRLQYVLSVPTACHHFRFISALRSPLYGLWVMGRQKLVLMRVQICYAYYSRDYANTLLALFQEEGITFDLASRSVGLELVVELDKIYICASYRSPACVLQYISGLGRGVNWVDSWDISICGSAHQLSCILIAVCLRSTTSWIS